MSRSFKSLFTLNSLFLAAAASCALVLFSVAATPRLGAADTPELPMPDGSGDTPEMLIDLLQTNLGPVAQIRRRVLRRDQPSNSSARPNAGDCRFECNAAARQWAESQEIP